jgi:bifunctional non-homologous end joining protein LigD
VRPRQELVIGGWHPGAAGRSGQLGSLQLGYYEHDSMHFAGKVGTGFKAHELSRLNRPLGDPATGEGPFSPAPPAFVVRTAHWVRRELVAAVTFGEWTDEGIHRHASYIATRDDKEPRAVVREA